MRVVNSRLLLAKRLLAGRRPRLGLPHGLFHHFLQGGHWRKHNRCSHPSGKCYVCKQESKTQTRGASHWMDLITGSTKSGASEANRKRH
jgi:hypothetical protein